MTTSIGRRFFELIEPIAVVTYLAEEPTAALMALGLPSVWDAYFAGRAAPLGRDTPAGVVDALFSEGAPPARFGRVSHLPKAQLAAIVDGMHSRDLIGDDGWLTPAGRRTKEEVESLTDRLAEPAYEVLSPAELDEVTEVLTPISARLVEAGSE